MSAALDVLDGPFQLVGVALKIAPLTHQMAMFATVVRHQFQPGDAPVQLGELVGTCLYGRSRTAYVLVDGDGKVVDGALACRVHLPIHVRTGGRKDVADLCVGQIG